MSTEQFNPYQSPLARTSPVEHDRRRWTWLPLVIVLLAACTYFWFTCILLQAGGVDRNAGMLFCLNLPVLAVWILSLVRADRRCCIVGCAAVGMHVLIHCLMLTLGIGEFQMVWRVNGLVVLALGFPVGACFLFAVGKRRPIT